MNCENCGRESKVNPCVDCYPNFTPKTESSFDNPISLKHWLLNMLVLSLPLINIVMLIIWAIGGGATSESKKNYARAQIIISAVMTIVIIAFYVAFIFLFFTALGFSV